MLQPTLTLSEVLNRLEAGELVALSVVKFDEKRGTGGEIMTINACRLLHREKPTTGPTTQIEEEPQATPVRGDFPSPQRRNPNHRQHFTRNVRLYDGETPSSVKIKIHPQLILTCNGQPVF